MNFRLLEAIKRAGLTQGELVRGAPLRSETRLSRIIHGYSTPTDDEISRICKVLNKTPKELDLKNE